MFEQFVKSSFRKFENFLHSRGYRVSWAPPSFLHKQNAELFLELEFVIAHLMLSKPSLFFIQIGANDGISNDPIHKFLTRFSWEGLLLEPLPEVFEILKSTYNNNPRLRLLNSALAEKDGTETIYSVRMDSGVFSKAHQFSSFRKDALLSQRHWVPDIVQRIEERKIKAISFETLLRETGGRQVDMLLMDTEGYDYTILKMIDFSRVSPAIIAYEHVHMSKAQQEECIQILLNQGYRATRGNLDTIAYKMQESLGFR